MMAASILPAAEVAACNELVHLGLTTCHAVSRFGTQLVGNQVEVSCHECNCTARPTCRAPKWLPLLGDITEMLLMLRWSIYSAYDIHS